METQAGVQWHPIASCLWPAQDWGQGWGVGRAAGSFLQQGPGGCWGEGAVGQESGLAGNLGKLPAILCLSFPIICEIKGLDSTVVFQISWGFVHGRRAGTWKSDTSSLGSQLPSQQWFGASLTFHTPEGGAVVFPEGGYPKVACVEAWGHP